MVEVASGGYGSQILVRASTSPLLASSSPGSHGPPCPLSAAAPEPTRRRIPSGYICQYVNIFARFIETANMLRCINVLFVCQYCSASILLLYSESFGAQKTGKNIVQESIWPILTNVTKIEPKILHLSDRSSLVSSLLLLHLIT